MMPVRRTQNWLPSIFNDFFDNEWMAKENATAPAINVIESEKEYKVEVAAPGMTKDDFNVRIDEDNNLVISMPEWAQIITIFNPLKYFMEVMRMIYLKGSGFFDLLPQF